MFGSGDLHQSVGVDLRMISEFWHFLNKRDM